MSFKELKIPEEIRSYRNYPQIIENEGCPQCKSLMIKVQVKAFKIGNLKFGCTCSNCGLFFFVTEDGKNRTLIFEYEQ